MNLETHAQTVAVLKDLNGLMEKTMERVMGTQLLGRVGRKQDD